MPELPEVETVRSQLDHEIKGSTIKDIDVRFGGRLTPGPKKFVELVRGKKVIEVQRRAKLLIFKLSGGLNILAHLKMTGGFYLKKKGTAPSKFAHVIFKLKDGREVHWEDIRKFGFLKLMTDQELQTYLDEHSYGPEPLEKSFTWKVMAECLRTHPKKKIKPLLMEQTCIAGIGNIYAVESVWSAKLHPLTLVRDVDDVHMKALHKAVVTVLKNALPARGSSAENFLDVYGEPGNFVPKLKVYGRVGRPCKRCGTALEKMVIAGRGTAYCPVCQAK